MEKKNDALRRIGVWMDHSDAKLIEPEKGSESIRTIHSHDSGKHRFPGESSDGTRLGNYRASNNEFSKHRKDENKDKDYYELLADELEPYNEIFVFGPTTAAQEFRNFLTKVKSFSDKKLELEKSDYLTEPQMFKLVREHFKFNN
jgi:hypothetical protein